MKKILFTLLIFTGIFSFAQQADVENYIKKESIGGKLDFTKNVEREYATPFIRFGDTIYNKKDFTILLWAAKVRALGIESLDKTIILWENINRRSLTDPEKKALKTGFESKF